MHLRAYDDLKEGGASQFPFLIMTEISFFLSGVKDVYKMNVRQSCRSGLTISDSQRCLKVKISSETF